MLRKLLARGRDLAWSESRDRETQDELARHLELVVAEKQRCGLDAAEARRQARLELGNPEVAREVLREGRTGSWLDLLMKDMGYALRLLRKRPAWSAACLLTVALGVGASTALFAVVDVVVLEPLPLPDPASLVRIYDSNLAKGVERTNVTSGNLQDWRRRTRSFRGLAGHYTMGRTLTLDGESEVVLSAQVTEDFFSVLGVRAALGRTPTPDETRIARFNSAAAPVSPDPVVALGHGLWTRRFGADPAVVGRTILVERRPMRVVGVMPEGFAMPAPDVQLFLPWGLPETPPRDQHYVSGLARLGPGATLAQAEAELVGVAGALAAEFPRTNAGWSVRLVPLQEDIVGAARPTLLVLLLSVALVLVVACANVALLSLARSLERLPEASLRQALGASRERLLRQFLMEPLLVSLVGGALGVLLAVLGLTLLKQTGAAVPRLHEVGLGPLALGFASVATLLAALLSGLPVALRLARAEPFCGLAAAPSRLAGGRRHALRDGLVVAEVAMAVVLLAGASLLVRSYQRLQAVDPGFDPRGVLVAPVFLDMEQYGGDGAKSRHYYATLVERLRGLPGVIATGAATALPASPLGPDFERPVWPEGAADDERPLRSAWVRMVTTDYFRTLGMRIVSGRAFDDRDSLKAPRSVMLSEGLARRLYPGSAAVGRRLVLDYSTAGTYPYDVIGVVGDVRFSGPRAAARHEIYLPHAQRPYLVMNVAVRSSGDPRLIAPAVRQVLHELDPAKPAHGLYDLSDLVGATYARDRYLTLVLSAFAAVAVVLALVGVHGVLSHRVRERTREIGIRIAVGASETHLLRWITGQGLRLVLLGLGLGAAIAAALARVVAGLLFGTSPLDPAALLAVAALPLVALLVSLHPAWRAARTSAAEVLRAG
ncbi:MAG TPA: ADOP family duplicated permease [Vicinamibacteria bacterium]|nr:ADOP family duplicated permease [Vicinamibacteria bacterium]